MRFLVCLLLLLATGARALDLLDPAALVQELSTQAAGPEKWRRPDFCGKMDCPPYSTEQQTDNYDIRKYSGGKWVVTNTTDSKFEVAYTKAVAKLLKYFKGGNDKEESFDITTPTLAALKLDKEGKAASKDYSFALWLPEDIQKDTPQPTDSDVKVVEFEGATVYVRIFGGFATEGTILKETRSLQDILEGDGRDYSGDMVLAAVYDPPQKLLRRHNEIHIPYSAKKA